jgi:hypothetical protein
LQAQTRQILCPVSDGSFLSAAADEFDVPTPDGSPVLPEVEPVVVLEVEPVVVLEVEPVVVLEDCVLDRVPEDCVPEN